MSSWHTGLIPKAIRRAGFMLCPLFLAETGDSAAGQPQAAGAIGKAPAASVGR